MSDEWPGSAFRGAVVGCALAVALIAISWAPHTSRPAPKWEPGSFVHSVLTGQAGQVIEARCRRGEKVCYYDVRFRDLMVTPLMHEWELELGVERPGKEEK